MENDAAQDVLARWQEWIDGPKSIGYDKAIDRYFHHWGDAIEYGDSITNSEVIALLALHLDGGLEVPSRLRDAAIRAISRELEPESLAVWEEPDRRKLSLEDLLVRIRAKRIEVQRPSMFRDAALQFKNASDAKRELMKLARRNRESAGSEFLIAPKILPPFLKTLNRFAQNQILEKDFGIADQARVERCMMLAWYIAMTCGFSIEQFERMLDDIASSKH